MAEKETIVPIKIDGTEAITTLKDLREAIKANRDALVALGRVEDSDTDKREKQAKIIKELKDNTELLNSVMTAAKRQNEDTAKAVDIATGSYDDLNAELRQLRKSFHAMTAAERESDFGKETITRINELDVKLKDLDGSVGQYQRNVGNYGKTYKESLDSARESTDQLRTGFEALNGIAILADEDAGALTKTIAGFQVVSNLLEGSKGIGGVVEKGKEWLAGMKNQNAGMKLLTGSMVAETTATGAATIATNIFKKALISTGIGAVVVAIGTLIAHLDDLVGWFKDSGDAAEDFAAANERASETLERLSRESERSVLFMKAEGATEKEILEYRKKAAKEALDATLAGTEANDKAWENYLKILDEVTAYEIRKRRENKEEAEKIEQEKAAAIAEAMKRETEERKRQLEKQQADEIQSVEQIKARLEEGQKSDMQKLAEKYEEERALLIKHNEDTTALDAEYDQKRREIREAKWAEDFDIEVVHNELTNQAAKDRGLAEIQIEQETSDEKKRIREEDLRSALDVSKAGADAVSGLLSSLADVYEANGANDRKAMKKAKNLRIASATIDMISGATTAFSSAFSLGPIAGPIVGAVNAAAVLAAGAANIMKIKNTPIDGNSAPGGGASAPAAPGAVNAPTIPPQLPMTRSLTSATEEDRLNRMAAPQRVYVVESDIAEAGDRRKARVEESSF